MRIKTICTMIKKHYYIILSVINLVAVGRQVFKMAINKITEGLSYSITL